MSKSKQTTYGMTSGVCPNCVRTQRGYECSFTTAKNGTKTEYRCESCGTVYHKAPRKPRGC
jgi:uncharacterized Zn finger protein